MGARGGRAQRLGYALGHALNDGCAAVWFTYALSYLAAVAGVGQQEAGVLVLLGQLVDGFATPIVGLLCDSTPPCGGFGRRRPYHLAGVVLVACSFPVIFGGFVQGSLLVPALASAVTLFQVGWATSQVSHLALVPELASSKEERTSLNSLRYGTTVACSLGVYVACWYLFGTSQMAEDGLGPEALGVFRVLAVGIVAAGSVAAVVFHFCLWGTEDEKQVTGKQGAGVGTAGGRGVDQDLEGADSSLSEGLLVAAEKEGGEGGNGGGGLRPRSRPCWRKVCLREDPSRLPEALPGRGTLRGFSAGNKPHHGLLPALPDHHPSSGDHRDGNSATPLLPRQLGVHPVHEIREQADRA